MSISLDKKTKCLLFISDAKCVNSVTYFQNYVTFIILRMFTFVRQVSNMNAGNEKYYKTDLACSTTDDFHKIRLKPSE
jgi:hypothetical protein